jgi:hypothetical protein
MWDLNNTQAKEFVIKYLTIFLESKGFVLKKTRTTDIYYYRKTVSGHDTLYLSFLDSFPGKKINYVLMKRIESIENIVAEIIKVVDPNQKIDKNHPTFATSEGTVKDLRRDSYMPEMVNEKDVENSCNILIQFLETTGLPMVDRFEDMQELDNEINGENFWENVEHKPFNLGLHFSQKRMIIARLANQGNFDRVMQKSYEWMDNWCMENNQPLVDKTDITKGTPYIEHYLRNLEIIEM